MNVNKAFTLFLEELSGQSAENRRNYKMRLEPFLRECGELPLSDISPAHVNRWHAEIGQRDYEEATMAGHRQAIKAFFNFCVRNGWIARSPAAHLKIGSFISKKQKLPSEKDVAAAEKLARGWMRYGNITQLRDALIFMISVQSGPRMREIRELRLSEVVQALEKGPDDYGIYRVRSRGKTGEILIRFDGDVAEGLERWIELRPPARVDRLFTGVYKTGSKTDPELRYRPLSRTGATKPYQRVAKAAGLKRPILSHALRHRLGDRATKLYGAKTAAYLLNHKDAETAATAIAFYHHPDENDISRAAAEMATASLSENNPLIQGFFKHAKRKR